MSLDLGIKHGILQCQLIIVSPDLGIKHGILQCQLIIVCLYLGIKHGISNCIIHIDFFVISPYRQLVSFIFNFEAISFITSPQIG